MQAPINFTWGDISQSAMGYQLATLGNYFLENNEGINGAPYYRTVNSMPFEESSVPGLPTRSRLDDFVFSRGKLVPRCIPVQETVTSYIVDAEDVYQLLVGLCEQRGSGRGSLTTAVAKGANLGLAQLKKVLHCAIYVRKSRDRLFYESGSLLEESQTHFRESVE